MIITLETDFHLKINNVQILIKIKIASLRFKKLQKIIKIIYKVFIITIQKIWKIRKIKIYITQTNSNSSKNKFKVLLKVYNTKNNNMQDNNRWIHYNHNRSNNKFNNLNNSNNN